MSCAFIKKFAQNVGFTRKDYPTLLSSILYSDGKMVYPRFFYSKVLFMHMQKTKSPVLVILEKILSYLIMEVAEGGCLPRIILL